MKKYVLHGICGYVYDPAEGDPEAGSTAGHPFESLPEEWVCPVCAVGKDMFEPEDSGPKQDLTDGAILLSGLFDTAPERVMTVGWNLKFCLKHEITLMEVLRMKKTVLGLFLLCVALSASVACAAGSPALDKDVLKSERNRHSAPSSSETTRTRSSGSIST